MRSVIVVGLRVRAHIEAGETLHAPAHFQVVGVRERLQEEDGEALAVVHPIEHDGKLFVVHAVACEGHFDLFPTVSRGRLTIALRTHFGQLLDGRLICEAFVLIAHGVEVLAFNGGKAIDLLVERRSVVGQGYSAGTDHLHHLRICHVWRRRRGAHAACDHNHD